MSKVNQFIRQIEELQKNVNDAVVKRDTQISKRESILQQLNELELKCQKEFGCSVTQLASKKQAYQKQMNDKINNLKKVLGINE